MPKSLSLDIQKGESVRKYLHNKELLDIGHEIQASNNRLYLPLTRSLTKEEMNEVQARDPTASIVEKELPEIELPPKSHLELLAEKLPEEKLEIVPRSFDTIGDIVVIEIPPELWEKRKMIGEALMQVHSSINAVYAKAGKVSGVNRIRPLEHLVGEKRTKTIYKEHGSRFAVDLKKAYFSPRLSEEHHRVATQVKAGETVVDLFCGVGPFAIPIAKETNALVHAIDINPDAIDLLQKNIKLNKLQGKIIPYTGDCRKVVTKHSLEDVADRAIMNLPGYAIDFLDVACKVIKPTGGIVHFYEFVAGETPEETIINDLKREILKENRTVSELLNVRRVRMSAPRQWQMVVDARIL